MENKPENISNELLAAFLCGELDDSGRATVEEWIAASDENRVAFNAFRRIWDLSALPANEMIAVDTASAWEKLSARISLAEEVESVTPVRRLWEERKFWLRVAAVFIPVALGSLFFFQKWTHPPMQHFSSGDAIKTLTFPDGSVSQVNRNSQMDYPGHFTGTNRRVRLSGQAAFDVIKIPGKTFLVEAGLLRVRVLGTRFTIDAVAANDSQQVWVQSGKVAVYANRAGEFSDSLILLPGEKAVYIQSLKTFSKENFSTENDLFWQTRILKFRNSPLKEVFRRIEKEYRIHIEVQSPEILELPLTTTFENLPPNAVMDIIAGSLKLKISKRENDFIVHGLED